MGYPASWRRPLLHGIRAAPGLQPTCSLKRSPGIEIDAPQPGLSIGPRHSGRLLDLPPARNDAQPDTHAILAGLVGTLERRGCACRRSHASHRPMLLVEITEAGGRVVVEYRLRVHPNQRSWPKVLTCPVYPALHASLAKLMDRLENAFVEILPGGASQPKSVAV